MNAFIIFRAMLIDGNKLRHWIETFYGYGSWKARFWFIGYEESGGEVPEEVADKINYFYNMHPPGSALSLCDIREVYRHVGIKLDGPKAELYANRYEFRFDKHAVQNGVWKNLIAFVHGYQGKKLPDFLSYQKQSFASPVIQQEALISFYPLPSPHNHAWYYSWLDLPELPFLRKRTLYEEYLFENRIRTILSNIQTYKPEVVLMYGMTNINALKKSVAEFFAGANFKMVKAVKLKTPQHHRAVIDGTTLIITTQIPALRHGRIETGFDWEGFGRASLV